MFGVKKSFLNLNCYLWFQKTVIVCKDILVTDVIFGMLGNIKGLFTVLLGNNWTREKQINFFPELQNPILNFDLSVIVIVCSVALNNFCLSTDDDTWSGIEANWLFEEYFQG